MDLTALNTEYGVAGDRDVLAARQLAAEYAGLGPGQPPPGGHPLALAKHILDGELNIRKRCPNCGNVTLDGFHSVQVTERILKPHLGYEDGVAFGVKSGVRKVSQARGQEHRRGPAGRDIDRAEAEQKDALGLVAGGVDTMLTSG